MRIYALLLLSSLVVAPPLSAGELSLEVIFAGDQLFDDLPTAIDWHPSEDLLLIHEGSKLLLEDPMSGESRILISAETAMLDEGDGEFRPVSLKGARLLDDERLLLAEGPELILGSLSEDGWHLDVLSTGPGVEEKVEVSPDGRLLGYVRDNDLWVYDLQDHHESRISDDGSEMIFNGIFDWVYWEEIGRRDSYAWSFSPDSRTIAWLRLDDSPIEPFHLVDLSGSHSALKTQNYPKAGDPLPLPSLNWARLDEDNEVESRWQRAFSAKDVPYIVRFGWLPAGDAFWYQKLDRAQESLELVKVSAASGDEETLLVERDTAWVEAVDMLHFFDDGSFLWASRASGFMQLELHNPSGGLLRQLTSAQADVTDLLGVRGNGVYIQVADPLLERHLFRIDLGKGPNSRITEEAGSHDGELSPSGGLMIVTSESVERAEHVRLFAGRELIRVLAANDEDDPKDFGLGSTRFLQIEAADGTLLDASLLRPTDFDPERRYPVLIYTYGGPHAQIVRNHFGPSRGRNLFHHWLAQNGVLVFSLDNRGSAAHGRDFEVFIDKDLGKHALADQLAGLEWLQSQAFVDPDRVAIWGWSFGAYVTTYALSKAPQAFAGGVAVAPVTDWRLYDNVYTERYMHHPLDNRDGYDSSSVLEAIGALERPLLVIHGTGDDNVHFQNTLQLADRAWRAGVSFDLKLYPGLNHGLQDEAKSRDAWLSAYRAIAAHLLEVLGVEAELD